MKFRVLSDLHIDVNRNHPFDIPKRDQGMFTVLAGDLAATPPCIPPPALQIKEDIRPGCGKTLSALDERMPAADP